MRAARIYGPRDIRIEDVPEPPPPGPGDVLLRITAVGICGSDLHVYKDGHIGGVGLPTPMILGHEFGGEVIAVGADARDGLFQPLRPGQRVAVDPCSPCYQCEQCQRGHPNLCPHLTFYGLYPEDGALQEHMICHARNCFPLPDDLGDRCAPLLETLGIAIHSLDLSKLKIANSAAVLGCGPVGLLILRLAKLAGADPIYAFDRYPWRVEKARAWGATHARTLDEGDPVEFIQQHTDGRGVDVAFEAAWADESVQQAADMLRFGGRLMLVGIPSDDMIRLRHTTARRKGLSLITVRRMKHTYPRAIRLATAGKDTLDLADLISHVMPLDEVGRAFDLNLAYAEGVHKIIIDV